MNDSTIDTQSGRTNPGAITEVFWAFLRLGVTSFGGPVAHLGYFRDAFVERRQWFSDRAYADLVALCQFLPGPASSQIGMAIGLQRAGIGGLLAAWFAFTMPSAIFMVAFAIGLASFGDLAGSGWLYGLKAAAVAVVAQAVFGMAKNLTPDAKRATIAGAAMIIVLLVPNSAVQGLAIVIGGLVGLVWLRGDGVDDEGPRHDLGFRVSRTMGVAALTAFIVLLALLPIVAAMTGDPSLRLLDVFYRSGSLVFGGGHVVLPLLNAETVQTGLVEHNTFLAGYGAAQAVPGPLFTFAAFLGASTTTGPTGLIGAAIALVAIFLPAGLLTIGALPFWERLRHARWARRALMGINGAVVGILAAALYDPVFAQGITSPTTLALAVVVFIAQTKWNLPAWAAVIGAGLVGLIFL
ncbi:chromate efflux transporter [Brevibacterium sp. GP-SGM9]|uniref:chromate efflux transporter n=1 Tax=unclassified Brevibacterium TaxID=2614124 RepID=UPI001E2E7F9B|nr:MULTISPECIES: chromate efflux transporter [unclassified Brevibacterium]MCD1286453.1 chromate transporter [Brevibacterium sp. CCUG 69071]MDK8433821.1 chromate efflux transporter [Brevibacterium sp. H-BE7]